MHLKEFIDSKDVEFTNNLVDKEAVKRIEKEVGVSFGKELTEYILKYGYLAYKYVEMYGVNSIQLEESDLVKQTKYLHTYFSKLSSYIALENLGDGCYAVVSTTDEVFEYSSENDVAIDTGLKMYDYILKRFREVDDIQYENSTV